MGNGAGIAAAMEGIRTSVGALDALFLKDAWLDARSSPAAGSRPAVDPAGPDPVIDVLQQKIDNRLERLALISRLEAQLAAAKARDAAEIIDLQHAMTPPEAPLHERTYTEMSAVEEIAGVLTISSAAAGALVSQSRRLRSLPLALDALSAGTISWPHAKIIADETDTLSPAGATALVAHFLDPDAPNPARGAAPGDLVPSRFRAKARAWRERHHPESLEQRHAKSAAYRRMEYAPDRDGMAWLSAYIPADQAMAGWNRLTALSRGMQGPDESRTLSQLRADNFTEAILTSGSSSAGSRTSAGTGTDTIPPSPIRADVLVTVPVLSLFGAADEPAMLDGYGPIPASMARRLVADGASTFHRVLVDPRDGAPLEIGRTSYRLTKAMKHALRLRDGKCTFPGCNNHTPDNEADHLTAWHQGGSTGISNLAQLCPKHHHLKHNSRWTPTPATKNDPPGWTSPTGRHYKAEHHHWEPPVWPPGLLPGAPETRGFPDEEHPLEEPVDNTFEDAEAFSPDDSVWVDFYAVPPKLPEDPLKKWEWGLVHC